MEPAMSDAENSSKTPKTDPQEEPAGNQPASAGRAAFELPEGWFAVLLLVLVAALCSGLIAAYWPTLMGDPGSEDSNARLTALETRIGQIATGNAGAAASGAFEDVRRDLGAIDARVAAAEA